MSDLLMHVRKIAIEAQENWAQVGDQHIFVNDVIDQATEPAAKMTVGFARLSEGETLSISFPYDEVLVVTKGTFTVRPQQGESVTARPGEVIYLPAGSTNTHHADEDTEMVYVASPPSTYAEHVAQSAGG